MAKNLEDEWESIVKKEKYLLDKMESKSKNKNSTKFEKMKQEAEKKIPEKMIETLDRGFNKAFQLIFTNGVGVITKTFSEDELSLAFRVNDFRVDQRPNKKSLRQLEKEINKGNRFNTCATLVEGIGLGAIGVGLPDIPVFLGVLLKGIYETAIGYGFNYKEEKEQVLILKMISAALSDDVQKRFLDNEVELWIEKMSEPYVFCDLEEEIKKASKDLSKALLLSKFIQGFFVVGMFGGIMNPIVYQRISKYVSLKYKKRYLIQKSLSIKSERSSIL